MTPPWEVPDAAIAAAKKKPDPAVAIKHVRSDAAWWDGFLIRVNDLLREIGAPPCTTP